MSFAAGCAVKPNGLCDVDGSADGTELSECFVFAAITDTSTGTTRYELSNGKETSSADEFSRHIERVRKEGLPIDVLVRSDDNVTANARGGFPVGHYYISWSYGDYRWRPAPCMEEGAPYFALRVRDVNVPGDAGVICDYKLQIVMVDGVPCLNVYESVSRRCILEDYCSPGDAWTDVVLSDLGATLAVWEVNWLLGQVIIELAELIGITAVLGTIDASAAAGVLVLVL